MSVYEKKFCPNCDNILDIGKNPPKHTLKTISTDTPTYVSDSEDNSDDIIDNILLKIINNDESVKVSMLSQFNDDKKTVKKLFTSKQKYKDLDKKMKSSVDKQIDDLLDKKFELDEKTSNSVVAYYICKKCYYSKKIDEKTLITSRTSDESSDSYLNLNKFKNAIYNKTLPLTRRYICVNKSCVSHNDPEKREAVFYRIGKSLQVWYTCVACQSYWKGE